MSATDNDLDGHHRLVPRHPNGVEGASPPTAERASPAPDKYGRWLIDPPRDASINHATGKPWASTYMAGSFADVSAHVATHWPPGTRVVYAPEASPLPERAATPPRADAASFCLEAARLVPTDRRPTNADKLINFKTTALLWNAYRACKEVSDTNRTLTPHDVACMMELFKIARRFIGTYNADNYVDAAGYAGCAGELAAQEASNASPQKEVL